MADAAVSTSGVSKQFGSVTALEDVTLEVRRGEVVGLLGPNGAGKSSLIDLLLGYTFPDEGEVRVLGDVPAREPIAVRRRTGLLPETDTLLPRWTGREHLEFVSRARDGAGDPEALLHEVGLASAGDRSVETYSDGMRQRLALAVALVGSPELLLLDEPAAGLDPAGVATVRDIVERRNAEGCTVVLSSHRLSQIEAVADRVGVLVDGQLATVEEVAAIQRRVPSAVTAELRTRPSQSLVDRIGAREDVTSVSVAHDRIEVRCADDATMTVVGALEDAGLEPGNVEIDRDILEDYVLSITGEGEGSPDAGGEQSP